jgi:hypothetical protein
MTRLRSVTAQPARVEGIGGPLIQRPSWPGRGRQANRHRCAGRRQAVIRSNPRPPPRGRMCLRAATTGLHRVPGGTYGRSALGGRPTGPRRPRPSSSTRRSAPARPPASSSPTTGTGPQRLDRQQQSSGRAGPAAPPRRCRSPHGQPASGRRWAPASAAQVPPATDVGARRAGGSGRRRAGSSASTTGDPPGTSRRPPEPARGGGTSTSSPTPWAAPAIPRSARRPPHVAASRAMSQVPVTSPEASRWTCPQTSPTYLVRAPT